MRRCVPVVVVIGLASILSILHAQPLEGPAIGDIAPEFPPGICTDGNTYRLADLKGKIVVLDFFDPNSPKCRQNQPLHEALARVMVGQPIKFIFVAAWASPQDAVEVQKRMKIETPLFADTFAVMSNRYGLRPTIATDWSTFVIDPEGKIAGKEMSKAELENLVASTKAAHIFPGRELAPKLAQVAELFEYGQFAAGAKQLAVARRGLSKDDESLKAMQASLKKAGAMWLAEAEAVQSKDPVRAHELCTRITTLLPGDELAKSVQKPLQLLNNDKTVKADLLARPAFATVAQTMVQPKAVNKANLAYAFTDVAKRHPNSPTGARAKTLSIELGYQWPKKK